MRYLLRVEGVLNSVTTWTGRIGAWISVPLMIIIVFDVITRRFLVLGSTKLQEGEWHMHAVLFLLCFGFAYLRNAHVRISLVHERFSPTTQRWIEFIGCLIFAIPYCAIVFYFAIDFVERSWAVGEASDSATGLPFRWAIKGFLPAGHAPPGPGRDRGAAAQIRRAVRLARAPSRRRRTRRRETRERRNGPSRRAPGREQQRMFYIEDYLPAFMFAALALLLFSGFPVGFVLGGVGLAFGFIGVALDVFHTIQFFNLPLRIWGIADNAVLVAIPMFVFMGTMLERSGVAADLLY